MSMLRTSTALFASLSLMVPTTLPAQQSGAEGAPQEAVECPEGETCPPEQTGEAGEAESEAEPSAPEEGGTPEGTATDEAAPEQPASDGGVAAPEEGAQTPETDAGADAGAESETEPSAPEEGGGPEDKTSGGVSEGSATEESAPEQSASDDAGATAPEDGAAASSSPAEEEQAPETLSDGDAGSEVETESPAPEEGGGAEGETSAGTPEGAATEESAPEAPEDGADAGGESPEGSDAAAEEEPAGAAAPEEAPARDADGDGAEASSSQEAEGPRAREDEDGSEATDGGAAADEASGSGRVPAAAREGEASEEVEVTEETVTEETARSSDEEFETSLSESDAQDAGSDDDGPSDLEKALILGAGALAVGQMLRGGGEVVSNSGDRAVVERDGEYRLLKDDDALLRRPGAQVRTESFDDGSTRTTVTREDGSRVVTIRDGELRVVRRVRISPEGEETVLLDDTRQVAPVDVSRLPEARSRAEAEAGATDEEALRRALAEEADAGRAFSLAQIRDIPQVRELAPAVELDSVTFASGSSAVSPDQARQLGALGRYVAEAVAASPREMFLVEGHTDAVGDAAMNLTLSDRRAESVALALSEYFDVPPENLVVQGYGEQFLRVNTPGDERANRRVTLRRITPLLQSAAAQ